MDNRPFIVFLDIDGVLNNHKTDRNYNGQYNYVGLDEGNIAAFNRYLDTLDNYKIVLSTTWRRACHPEQLYRWMKKRGYKGPTFYDSTPDRGGYYCRAKEILAWLQLHEGRYRDYVVIDDIDMKDQFGNKQMLTTKKWGFLF